MTLPAHVRPLKYKLTLEPDLTGFTFRGEERIDLEVLEPTSAIALNCEPYWFVRAFALVASTLPFAPPPGVRLNSFTKLILNVSFSL